MDLESSDSIKACSILEAIYLGTHYFLARKALKTPFMESKEKYLQAMKLLINSFSKCKDKHAFDGLLKILVFRLYKIEEGKKYSVDIETSIGSVNVTFDYLTNCHHDFTGSDELKDQIKIIQDWGRKMLEQTAQNKDFMLKAPNGKIKK